MTEPQTRRDTPATEAGRDLEKWFDDHPYVFYEDDLGAMLAGEPTSSRVIRKAILAIEAQAADTERRRVLEQVRERYIKTDSYRLDEHSDNLLTILDELAEADLADEELVPPPDPAIWRGERRTRR